MDTEEFPREGRGFGSADKRPIPRIKGKSEKGKERPKKTGKENGRRRRGWGAPSSEALGSLRKSGCTPKHTRSSVNGGGGIGEGDLNGVRDHNGLRIQATGCHRFLAVGTTAMFHAAQSW